MTARAPTDVVVCVHNSPEDVRRCIASCVPTLGATDRLVIVDDGSADETRDICAGFAVRAPERVLLIRREQGSGFTRAANAGLGERRPGATVVLLNSDTVVLPGWLDRIGACFAHHPAVGIVGPLSNAGGWQSIPEFGDTGAPPQNRILNDDATLAKIQDYCSGLLARHGYPLLEQINGFCIAIRAEVLDTVGLLDEVAFPQGYGEEMDLNFRAQDAGFFCAVAVDCFVYHDKTKSYSLERRQKLIHDGRLALDRLHGASRVWSAVENSRAHPVMSAIRRDAGAIFTANDWLLSED